MRSHRRALLLSLLPALILSGLPAAARAAPTPSPLAPGRYSGTVNMTIMHNGSAGGGGISTEWTIDMVGSAGNINMNVLPLGTVVAIVDMPVPIDHHNSAKISDKASKCKGWTVTSSGFGRAQGSGGSRLGQQETSVFYFETMDFALSSFSPRIRKNGECPSDTWGPEARKAVDTDFEVIFGSEWTFTITPESASLAGTCKSAAFGTLKGQKLLCDWRAYRVRSE
jgi:hypothetical protein